MRTGIEMIASQLQRLRVLGRDVRYLLLTVAVAELSIGIYDMLLNLYLVRLGFAAPFVGLVNAVGFLSMGVFCVLGGP